MYNKLIDQFCEFFEYLVPIAKEYCLKVCDYTYSLHIRDE